MNSLRSKLPLIVQNLPKSSLSLKNPIRNYAFKSDLKIKWVRPEKIPCYKPEKSGDLEQFPSIDKSQIQLQYQQSKELESANDIVKKLFTLEFAPRRKTAELFRSETISKVKRHHYDVGSIEVKIARWTGIIRAWQDVMEKFPRNKRLKVHLKELIDKRKKHLKYLRRWDYKKFEWLLENLKIVYKPMPDEIKWVTRKDSLRKLTDKYCEDLRQQKLDAFKLHLEAEQPAFLQEKIRSLEFIRDEQKECNVEVTVTQEEIDDVKKQLNDLMESRNNKEKEL